MQPCKIVIEGIFIFLMRDAKSKYIGIGEKVEAVGYGFDVVVRNRDDEKVDYLVERVATHHSIPNLRPAECVYESRNIRSALCYRLRVSPSDKAHWHSACGVNQLLWHVSTRGVADEPSAALPQTR